MTGKYVDIRLYVYELQVFTHRTTVSVATYKLGGNYILCKTESPFVINALQTFLGAKPSENFENDKIMFLSDEGVKALTPPSQIKPKYNTYVYTITVAKDKDKLPDVYNAEPFKHV